LSSLALAGRARREESCRYEQAPVCRFRCRRGIGRLGRSRRLGVQDRGLRRRLLLVDGERFRDHAGRGHGGLRLCGGTSANPTYENHAGHLESVKVTYDPTKISYAQLVDSYYHHIDPTDPDGQICDKGPSYHLAVFTANAEERAVAEAARAKYEKQLGARITVVTRNAAPFWNAEGYHQDYYKKNPVAYERYRIGCGRPQALRVVWGGQEAH
jgi:peptide-methionine (S)-S-oxide reductase